VHQVFVAELAETYQSIKVVLLQLVVLIAVDVVPELLENIRTHIVQSHFSSGRLIIIAVKHSVEDIRGAAKDQSVTGERLGSTILLFDDEVAVRVAIGATKINEGATQPGIRGCAKRPAI